MRVEFIKPQTHSESCPRILICGERIEVSSEVLMGDKNYTAVDIKQFYSLPVI